MKKRKDPIKVIANMVEYYSKKSEKEHPGSTRQQKLKERIAALNMARALISGDDGTLTSMEYNNMLNYIGKPYYDFVQLKMQPARKVKK